MPTTPTRRDRAELAGAEILKLCVAVGGCLTGEHGVGIEKRDLMHGAVHASRPRACRCGSRACSIRNGCSNPAKVFPLDGVPELGDAGSERARRNATSEAASKEQQSP